MTAEVWAGTRPLPLAARVCFWLLVGTPSTLQCGSLRPGHLWRCRKRPPQSRRDFPFFSPLSAGRLVKGLSLSFLLLCLLPSVCLGKGWHHGRPLVEREAFPLGGEQRLLKHGV